MSHDGPRKWAPKSGTILRVLTLTQNTSALVFAGFLGVHLVSPLAASIGGSAWADRSLLLGREYYLPSETITIYLPLLIHLSSATLQRLYLLFRTRRTPPITSHLLTGWALPFLLLPHVLSHRFIPASPNPPISALSPSELNYEFVGHNLVSRPAVSWLSYVGLVGIGTWHAGVGMMKIVSWIRRSRGSPPIANTPSATLRDSKSLVGLVDEAAEEALGPQRKISGKRKVGLRGIMLVYLGIVTLGLIRVAKESRHVSKVMRVRYDAVYARLWPW